MDLQFYQGKLLSVIFPQLYFHVAERIINSYKNGVVLDPDIVS